MLTVTGNGTANTLTIEQTARTLSTATLELALDGAPVQSFRRVAELVVDTKAGADVVEMLTTINIDVTLNGGVVQIL